MYNSLKLQDRRLKYLRKQERKLMFRLKTLNLLLALESMQTDEYLEVQARDRLNFAGNSEFLFVIPEPIFRVSRREVDTYLNGSEEVEPVPTYMQVV